MHFITATKRATDASITQADIAEACKVSAALISRARMDPGNSSYRRPPEHWRDCLARLCRQRAEMLTKLADQIERGGVTK